jgi:hypothetical protein
VPAIATTERRDAGTQTYASTQARYSTQRQEQVPPIVMY